MKYKRQLMGSMFALALLMGNSSMLDVEDFVPDSKVGQYVSQVKMKSYTSGGDEKIDIKSKDSTIADY
jgi:hypothetical protein